MATNRRLGYSLIFFDPKASDVLRFGSTIVAAQSSIFYLPSSIAKGTLQTNEREREKMHILKHWQENKTRKGIARVIHDCDKKLIKVLCECALNLMIGNIPRNKNKLMPIEQQLKIPCQPQPSYSRRQHLLSSNKDNKLFKQIGRPCICCSSAEWISKLL